MEDCRERLELTSGTHHLLTLTQELKPGTIVFLDKTAHPLAHLFRYMEKAELGQEVAPNIQFLNIGTELNRKWVNDEDMNQIRNDAGLQNAYRVLIVDEFVANGDTLKTTKRILQDTFPNIEDLKAFSYQVSPSWMGFEEPWVKYQPVGVRGAEAEHFGEQISLHAKRNENLNLDHDVLSRISKTIGSWQTDVDICAQRLEAYKRASADKKVVPAEHTYEKQPIDFEQKIPEMERIIDSTSEMLRRLSVETLDFDVLPESERRSAFNEILPLVRELARIDEVMWQNVASPLTMWSHWRKIMPLPTHAYQGQRHYKQLEKEIEWLLAHPEFVTSNDLVRQLRHELKWAADEHLVQCKRRPDSKEEHTNDTMHDYPQTTALGR